MEWIQLLETLVSPLNKNFIVLHRFHTTFLGNNHVTRLSHYVFLLPALLTSRSYTVKNPMEPPSENTIQCFSKMLHLSCKQVMGTVKLISWKVSTWCNTKFSSLIYKEMCWSQKIKEACFPHFSLLGLMPL